MNAGRHPLQRRPSGVFSCYPLVARSKARQDCADLIHPISENENSRNSKSSILHSPSPIGSPAVRERVTSRPSREVSRGCVHELAPSCIVSSSCERTTGTIPSFRTAGLHWTGAMRPPAYPSTTTTVEPDRRARRPLDAVLAALMGRFMPDVGYELPRIHLLGRS